MSSERVSKDQPIVTSMTEEDVLPDQSPFPPLQLSFEEQQQCHQLSLQLLERTLHSYDERLPGATPRHHASLDSARWKLQRTQHNASLYSGASAIFAPTSTCRTTIGKTRLFFSWSGPSQPLWTR